MRKSLMAKLVAAFAAVALIVGAVSIYIMMESSNVAFIYEHEGIRLYKNHVRLAAIDGRIQRETADIRAYVLTRADRYLEDYRKADAEFLKLMTDLVTTTQHPESEEKMKTILALRDQYNQVLQRAIPLVPAGKLQEAQMLVQAEADPLTDSMAQLVGELAKVYGDAADRGGAEARAAAEKARTYGIAALSLGLVAALAAGVLLARYLSRPILRTARLAAEVAAGNLQVQPLDERAQDEVGQLMKAFNQMVRSLRTLVADLSQTSQRVTSSAQTLTETSEQASRASEQTATAIATIADGTSRQAETTGTVSGTVQQLRQAIDQVARGATQTSQDVQEAVVTLNRIVEAVDILNRNSGQAAAGSLQAAETARVGASVVAQTTEGMARIKAAVDASSARIRQLEQLSRQIGEISEVISGIAGQTNLLALNAAIEAARAGEHGKGFAVVAEEVRKLAESSSKSAKEIGGLIGSIQSGTVEVVQAMTVGISEVNTGHQLADKAGQALAEILGLAEKTASDIEGIAREVREVQVAARAVTGAFGSIAAVTEENTAATEQMAASAEQVTSDLTEIALISQENAAVAEEVSASSEELTATAEDVANSAMHLRDIAAYLQEQIAKFKV